MSGRGKPAEGKKIRVLLADDHDMVRQGIRVFFRAFNDLQLVGEASDGIRAVELCDELEPDVVLMDIVMPRMDGVEATRRILRKHPGIRIVVITSFEDEAMVQPALEAGAISYLHKNITIDDMGDAIRKAYYGEPTLSPGAARALIHAKTRTSQMSDPLTNREREVLRLMVDGLNNPEIAQKLTVSRSTVKTHVSNILSKLGVSSRLEAVKMAIEQRLIR